MKFQTILNTITTHPNSTMVIINNAKKHIKACIRLTAKNYLEGEYIKVRFTDDSYILIIPQDEEIYHSDQYTLHIKDIKDDQIGRDEMITFKDKTYKLGNKDDYQFVKKLIYGSPLDIEGECRFSDYFPVGGGKEFLSLGWLTRTEKRADIWCKIIPLSKIQIH